MGSTAQFSVDQGLKKRHFATNLRPQQSPAARKAYPEYDEKVLPASVGAPTDPTDARVELREAKDRSGGEGQEQYFFLKKAATRTRSSSREEH